MLPAAMQIFVTVQAYMLKRKPLQAPLLVNRSVKRDVMNAWIALVGSDGPKLWPAAQLHCLYNCPLDIVLTMNGPQSEAALTHAATQAQTLGVDPAYAVANRIASQNTDDTTKSAPAAHGSNSGSTKSTPVVNAPDVGATHVHALLPSARDATPNQQQTDFNSIKYPVSCTIFAACTIAHVTQLASHQQGCFNNS